MINEKDDIKKELEGLTDQPDFGTMQVPEGYFDRLEKEILDKTIYAGDNNVKGKVIRMRWMKITAGIAAVASLVFFGVRILNESKNEPIEIQFAKMSDNEIDQYISGQLAGLSYDDVHAYISANISEIETDLLFSTDFIDDASALDKLTDDVSSQVIQNEKDRLKTPAILDEDQLKNIDDDLLQDYLDDESVFDDFAL